MPIANCVISQECSAELEDCIKHWATESGISGEHMTINLIPSISQFGRPYQVMSNLILPSIWSAKDISLLQLGLAKALSKSFSIDFSEVQVVTTIVDSGLVVESGREITW